MSFIICLIIKKNYCFIIYIQNIITIYRNMRLCSMFFLVIFYYKFFQLLDIVMRYVTLMKIKRVIKIRRRM